jgi:hypothetical protein
MYSCGGLREVRGHLKGGASYESLGTSVLVQSKKAGTERLGRTVIVTSSYSSGTGFKYYPGNRLS